MNKVTAILAVCVLGVGGGLLAGCGTATNSGYTTTYDQYGRPVYTTVNNGYGQQVDQYGRPVYPAGVNSYGQPVDAYGQPIAVQPGYTDDYIYHPDSEVYYSPTRRDYVYLDGGRWEHHGAPPRYWNQSGVLVHLNFGGGDPWVHHRDVIRRYPRNWRDRDHDHDRDRDRDRGWDRR